MKLLTICFVIAVILNMVGCQKKPEGQKWEDVTPKVEGSGADGHLASWHFSGSRGWLVVGKEIYMTVDKGEHWSSRNISTLPSRQADMSFVNQSGWVLSITAQGAGSLESSLFLSKDGGRHMD